MISRFSPEKDGAWLAGVLAIPLLVVLLGSIFGHVSYINWDNFETYTPGLNFAHGNIINGIFPHWNPHQFLGEPLHAQTQIGALYPLYTLSYLLKEAAGLGGEWLTLIIVLLHLPLASAGWYFLLRHQGARPFISFFVSLSAVSGGFVTSMSSVWIFMFPIFSWLPWVFLGLLRLFRDKLRVPDILLFVLSLTAIAYVGISQMLVYTWIGIFLLAAGYCLFVLREPRKLLRLLPALSSSALLTAPVILPAFGLLGFTSRAEKFSITEFLNHSVSPENLAGALLPLYNFYDGFIGAEASVLMYQGAWVAPALIAGIAAFMAFRQNPAPDTGSRQLYISFMVTMVVALCFLLMALGDKGLVYPLTYGIPLWSSFRGPFKFLLFSNFFIALSAGLALEILARQPGRFTARRAYLFPALVLSALSLVLLYLSPSPLIKTAAGILSLCAGIVLFFSALLLDSARGRAVLVAVVIAHVAGTIFLSHDLGFKSYNESYGRFGAKEMGIDENYRYLPLSGNWKDDGYTYLQEAGLLWSATANGLYSATGCSYGLTPSWVNRVLPSNPFGVLPPDYAMRLVDSNLIRSLNVKYLIRSRADKIGLMITGRAEGYRLKRELRDVLVYENSDALERAYFASHAFKYTDRDFALGMLQNKAPLKSAFIDGYSGPPGPRAMGVVLDSLWTPNLVSLDVSAPGGGLLVFSMAYYPEWEARVDGARARVFRVNHALMGVELPPGSGAVRLEYVPRAFYLGLVLAAAGIMMLVAWILFLFGRDRAARQRPA